MIADDRSSTPAAPTAIPADRPVARTRAGVWVAMSYLLVVAVATWPRLLDLGRFVTEDEGNYWLKRSDIFINAILSGNVAATAITDHPGVTTMWLGGSGILLREWLGKLGVIHNPSFATMLGLMELPVALVHIAGILLGYALLRRLLDPWSAVLAAILWSVDPFVIGYSRVLHVDALSMTFMTLSVLAACVFWYRDERRWFLALSGICAALGFLSKSPGIALAPVVAGIAANAAFARGGGWARYRRACGQLVAWSVVALATALVVWPALWANLPAAIYQLRLGIIGEGAVPHALGAFFFDVVEAPGPLFYPVTLVMRTTPITLIALVLLPFALWLRRPEPLTRRALLALVWYIVLFTVMLSFSPKKFNRYLVPVFPALDVLAAVGLVLFVGWAVERARHGRAAAGRWAYGALVTVVAVAGSLNVASWHPYALVAYNQVLGGAPAGARVFMTGWGEGLEQVAAWLNAQPNITGVLTVTTMRAGLQSYLKPGAQSMSPSDGVLPPQAGYVVIYRQQAQMKAIGPPFDQFYGNVPPLLTVRIHGVEYAWVYEAPPNVAKVPATFAQTARLYGASVPQPVQSGEPLPVTLAWQPGSTVPPNSMLFAHLLAPDGQRVANIDIPVSSDDWRPDRYAQLSVPLTLPPGLPPGSYRLVIGLYNLDDGQRLPLDSPAKLDGAIDGPEALLLMAVDVP